MERSVSIEPIDERARGDQIAKSVGHVGCERRIMGRGVEGLPQGDRFEQQTHGVDLVGEGGVDIGDAGTALRGEFDQSVTGQTAQ